MHIYLSTDNWLRIIACGEVCADRGSGSDLHMRCAGARWGSASVDLFDGAARVVSCRAGLGSSLHSVKGSRQVK